MNKSLFLFLFLSGLLSAQVAPPQLVSVSVFNNQVWIDWSIIADASGYNIYRKVDTGDVWLLMHTVPVNDPLQTTWIDTDALINNGPVSYTMSSLGSNGVEGPINENFHSTIFASPADASCATELHLQWTAYKGLNAQLQEYRIFKGLDLLESVPGDQESYTYTLLPGETGEVCFTVTASVSGVGLVNSNESCLEICATGIDDQNTTEVHPYPLPFSDTVYFQDIFDTPTTLQIFDLNGKTVYAGQLNGTATLSTSAWRSGFYLFQIIDLQSGLQLQGGKILKQ